MVGSQGSVDLVVNYFKEDSMFALFSGMAVGTVIFVSIFGILLYFVPSFVAWKRKHRQLVPIIFVNVFFGWSLIGWVAALVWAFINYPPLS